MVSFIARRAKILAGAFAIFMLPASTCLAQETDPFGLPGEISVPAWVRQTNWKNVNVFKVDSLIEVYKATEKRRESSDNEAEEFHEDPYLNAYVRWRTGISPFIQPDGTIKYDPEHARRELIKSLEAQHTKTEPGTAAKSTALASWTLLGPSQTYNVGTGALKNYQTNIYCIAIAPSNPSVLYAASEPGNFYRSADKGLNWTSVSNSLTTCGNRSIAVDPWNENIVYAYDGTASTLLKTTSGGATWSALTGYTGSGGNAIAVNPNTGRVLIAGSTTVYYSDNGGTTWTAAAGSTVTGSLYDIVLNPAGTDTVYVAGSSGGMLVLLRSTNGGTTFTDVTGATISGTSTSGARLAVTPAATGYVYCVNLGGSSTPPRIIRSTDGGSSWSVTATSTSTSLTGTSATTGLGMSNGQGFYDLGIMASPYNANHVIVGTTTTYKSTDGGVNFAPLGGYAGPFGLHPDIQQAVVLGSDAYIATDGGVNYSSDFFTNTSNWSVRNNGLRSADYWGFGQGWDEDIVVGGRYHNGNAALFDVYGGGKALSLGGGEDATGHVYHGFSRTTGFRDIGNVIIPATLTGAAQYSAGNVPNSMWPQDNYYGQFSSKLMTDPRYANVFYLGKDTVLWKSSNRGSSYQALHDFGPGNKVWRFDIARSNPQVIYVCVTNGVYITTDGGATWSSITLPVTWQYYNSDIVVNPLNENDVYLCMANGAAANKVFRSVNGGSSWTNITGTALNGKKVAFLQYQGGAGGVYAVTNNRPSKVYYRDTTMSDWFAFSDGLPQGLEARVGALIFYRDSKLRLAGNSSIWETPLYATGAPVAQPMADRKNVGCPRDTVNFFDYSMYDHAGASRTWSFPGALWVSSTTALRPQVVYPSAGSYTVSLSVTNALGQTHTKTIPDMVVVANDNCSPDTVAGKCLQMNGNSQTVSLGVANINSNNFSISCWIKPEGKQKSFSQIVGHPAYPGSANYGFGLGFKFNGYTPNLILCYTDSTVNYSGTSTLVCDSTRWNHVVLTYSPSRVVIYLNGVGDTVNNGPMPVIDLSQTPFQINYDVHNGQGSKYKGLIEEVKFYNYALTQEEVREKMHLITDPATEAGLLKYFQFNQYDPVSGSVYDVKGNFNVLVPSANIVTSSAPVATGRVLRLPLVATGGLTSFGPADVDEYLPASGTYPDGEVVAFHLLSGPDTRPDFRPAVPGYFIINNYGTNKSFSSPDSVVFSRLNITYPGYEAGNFRLFKRATGDFGNTWSAELDSADRLQYVSGNSKLTWRNNVFDTSFNAQYIIVNNDTTNYAVATGGHTMGTWVISDPYPNPCREWLRMDISAPVSPESPVNFTLCDITGRQVMSFSERLSVGRNALLIHLPSVAQGTYLLSAEIPGEGRVTRKVSIE